MLTDGQDFRQLKQPTHREKSTFISLMLMHDDLHTAEHFPHCVQLTLSMLILNTDIRERTPRKVPTGQTVLQNSRPCQIESQSTTASIKMGKAASLHAKPL